MLDDRRLNILAAGAICITCVLLGMTVMPLGGAVMYSAYEQDQPGAIIFGAVFALVGLGIILAFGYPAVTRLRKGNFLTNYPEIRPLDNISTVRSVFGAIVIGGGFYLFYITHSAGGGFMGYTFAMLAGLFGILTILGISLAGGSGDGGE